MGQRLAKSGEKRARLHVCFIDEAYNQQGTGAGICKYQSKIQQHISLGQDATAFQAEVATVLDYVTKPKKKTGEGADYNLR